MNSARPSLTSVDPEDPAGSSVVVDQTTAQVDADAFEDSPRWPVMKLAGLSLMALLCVCLAGPMALAGLHGAGLLALALPAALATISARVLFEAIDPGARGHALRSHVVPALLAASMASALLTAAAVVIAVHWSLGATAASAALGTGALATAGVLRDLEVRVRLAMRRVYFVGSPAARRDLEQELRRRSDASFAGAARTDEQLDVARLVDAVQASQATVLVIDRDAMRLPSIVEAASKLNLAGMHVRDLVSYYESEFKKVPLDELSPTWFLFDIAPIHRQPFSHAVRRVTETLLAALLLVVSLPVLLAGAVVVRLTSPGPALYRQRRVGRGGVHFTLVKLRTMTVAEESASWAPSQSHRVTRVGLVLRRFRLDELPQLWNVIRGDMALIGPRPEQVAIAERLERDIPFYNARHCIRPGLTGWAQVNLGYAGSVEGTVAKLQRDLYYIKHSSLRLDGLIVWMTLKTIVSGRG